MRRRVILLTLLVSGTFGAGCASSGAVPRPFPGASAPARPAAADPAGEAEAATAEALVDAALAFTGTPYRNGGSDPRGFDCSGLIWYVFAQHGLAMPRTTAEQFEAGIPVRPDELTPGDLVFFTTIAPGPSHVGMFVGGDRFVHAPSSNGTVRVERLSAEYWSERYLGARRVIP